MHLFVSYRSPYDVMKATHEQVHDDINVGTDDTDGAMYIYPKVPCL